MAKNVLTRKNYLRLADWMRVKAQDWQGKNPLLDTVAAEASKVVGVAVTKNHILAIGRDLQLGVRWQRKEQIAAPVTDNRITGNLYYRVRVLEHLVDNLYTRLGETKPQLSNGVPEGITNAMA